MDNPLPDRLNTNRRTSDEDHVSSFQTDASLKHEALFLSILVASPVFVLRHIDKPSKALDVWYMLLTALLEQEDTRILFIV